MTHEEMQLEETQRRQKYMIQLGNTVHSHGVDVEQVRVASNRAMDLNYGRTYAGDPPAKRIRSVAETLRDVDGVMFEMLTLYLATILFGVADDLEQGRPIEERMRSWKWWGEQVAHLVGLGMIPAGAPLGCYLWLGSAAPSLAVALGLVLVGELVSIAVGNGREIVQNWGDAPRIGSAEDSMADTLAVAIGRALGPLVALGVTSL